MSFPCDFSQILDGTINQRVHVIIGNKNKPQSGILLLLFAFLSLFALLSFLFLTVWSKSFPNHDTTPPGLNLIKKKKKDVLKKYAAITLSPSTAGLMRCKQSNETTCNESKEAIQDRWIGCQCLVQDKN